MVANRTTAQQNIGVEHNIEVAIYAAHNS